MTIPEIIGRINGEIKFHEDKAKNCAPTEYSVHTIAIEILTRYKQFLQQHQKWIESKCREMIEVLRGV